MYIHTYIRRRAMDRDVRYNENVSFLFNTKYV